MNRRIKKKKQKQKISQCQNHMIKLLQLESTATLLQLMLRTAENMKLNTDDMHDDKPRN